MDPARSRGDAVILSELLAWLGDSAHWTGPSGVPTRVLEHIYYTVITVLLASVVAVPLGLAIGHTGRGGIVLVLSLIHISEPTRPY